MRAAFLYVGLLGGLWACAPRGVPTQTQATRPDTTRPPRDTVVLRGVPAFHFGQYQAARTRRHDLLHTRLELRFDWEKQHVIGEATLQLVPYFYPQDTLELDAKGFDIRSVALLDGDARTPVAHQYDGRKLRIDLGRSYTRRDTFDVHIAYVAKPNELPAGGSQAITSDKGLYFINPDGGDPDKPRQIWTQGETESSSCWFPTIDSPNERCTQEILLTVEDQYTTLSNGLLIYSTENRDGTRTDYWKLDQPHAPYLFMVAVGEFAKVEDTWNDLAVDYYVEPAYAPYARDIFGHTPEMMQFFSDRLGIAFPWPKYAQIVVRDFVSGAMENTTASVFMEDVQMTRRELLDQRWDFIIAHELFHQWFGDLVTCESWAHLTLNEGFANYSEYLWSEYKFGRDEADYQGLSELDDYLNEARTKQEPLIRPYYRHREEMFDNHSYAKGGRVLHMLRHYVGDEAFFAALRHYLQTHAYTAVEVHDLRLAFERVTGQDLNWFFEQWFMRAGHPQLRVSHLHRNGRLQLTVEQIQDTVATPRYRLPLAVAVWHGDRLTRYPLVIEQARQIFTFDMPEAPSAVLFDADQQLLAEVEHRKTPAELIHQYRHSLLWGARHEALITLQDEHTPPVLALMQTALSDGHWSLREQAADYFAQAPPDALAEVEGDLLRLAQADSVSSVRVSALQALVQHRGDEVQPLVLQALRDSSYLVAASALDALLNGPDTATAATVAERYADATHPSLVSVMAEYYVTNANPRQYNWFRERVLAARMPEKYYLVQQFGRYALNLEAAAPRRAAAELLIEMAKTDASIYGRLGAYQALGLLMDMEGVPEARLGIRKQESDEQLRRFYESMP